jgi:mannose-6-phosphate isomerase-like protein (cupin superfamily)
MFTVKAIDELQSIHGGAVKLAASELGIESFGLQILEFPGGFEHYPEHDHSHDGQEEVYVVLRGSGAFVVDGERVEIDPGRILRVSADSRRRLEVGPEGIRFLAIGCAADRPYERPEDFRVAVSS